MHSSLTITRKGSFQGAPFYEVHSAAGQLLASGPFDHCANVMKAYLA